MEAESLDQLKLTAALNAVRSPDLRPSQQE
jgi:hypothetical protein